MDPSREAIVRDLSGGLDLDRRRNYTQLAVGVLAGVLAAIGGAVIGFCKVERSGLAAAVGAAVGVFLGFVAGIFLAGFVLMFRPASKISVEAAMAKHKNLERSLWRLLVIWVLISMGTPLIILWLGNDERPWAWVACILWMCASTGLCAYLKVKKAALEQFAQEIDGQQAKRHV